MVETVGDLWPLIKTPARALGLDGRQWTLMIRLARREFVLGRLAAALRGDQPTWARLPEKPRLVMEAALRDVDHRQRRLMWEVDRLGYALSGLDVPVLLLKGAAYLGSGLKAGDGRIAADLDILTVKAGLATVEAALKAHDWVPEPHDAYDDHYYRAWMHELPPLRHRERGTVIDVHHAILPLTAGPKPSTDALLAASVPCGGTGFRRLGDHDLFIHSAAHLFHDGAFVNAFRNLIELFDLLNELGDAPDFLAGLMPRARALGLGRYTAYALRYAQRLLGAAVPPDIKAQARRDLPPAPILLVMDHMIGKAVMGVTVPAGRPRALLAQRLLYVRSHWLRMPPLMLARHLTRKTFKRARDGDRPTPPAVENNG